MTHVLFIGCVPPPHHGVAGANEILLRGAANHPGIRISHLDISDRRPITTVEKFDWGNVRAALVHGVQCWARLLRDRPHVVYLAISQKTLGFLRDCFFLLPARWLRRAVVIHLHGGNFHAFYTEASPMMQWFIRYAIGRAARGVVLGECLRDCFAGLLPAEKIAVVPNGIPDFARGWQRDPHPPLRVLYLGTVTRAKGIEIFLQAAQRLNSRQVPLEFQVAGPWYSEQERRELAPLCKGVHILGEVSGQSKLRAWREADIFVFPGTQQEGLPLVVLEAMCAGLPVIATDRGCLREVVQHGRTGYLIAPGDVEALVQRLAELAANPQLTRQLGEAGRQRYESVYRAEQFVARMINVWNEAAQLTQQ